MTEDTEKLLIAKFREGDSSAFAELFEAHQCRVLHLALHVLRHEQLALEVAQQAFVHAYEELHRWRGDARLGSWLYRTVLNLCFESIRTEEKHRRFRDRIRSMPVASPPEREVYGNEVSAAIDEAVNMLPARQREIFVLKQYEHLHVAEIAVLLNITTGGVKANYYKAIRALRRSLKSYAPEPAPEYAHKTA